MRIFQLVKETYFLWENCLCIIFYKQYFLETKILLSQHIVFVKLRYSGGSSASLSELIILVLVSVLALKTLV